MTRWILSIDYPAMSETPRALNAPAPMRVWAISISIFLVIFGVVYVLILCGVDLQESLQRAINKSRIAKLEHAARSNAFTIVVVGSSQVFMGLRPDELSHRAISSDTAIEVITRSNNSPEWFISLVPDIKRLHPNLLLVHQDVLLKAPRLAPDVAMLFYIESNIFTGIQWARGASFPPEQTCPPLAAKMDANLASHYNEEFAAPTLPTEAIQKLEELRAAGIAVATLYVPRAPQVTVFVPNARIWHRKFDALLAKRAISTWSPSGDWGGQYFCDYGHLNDLGRSRFEDWFTTRLNAYRSAR